MPTKASLVEALKQRGHQNLSKLSKVELQDLYDNQDAEIRKSTRQPNSWIQAVGEYRAEMKKRDLKIPGVIPKDSEHYDKIKVIQERLKGSAAPKKTKK